MSEFQDPFIEIIEANKRRFPGSRTIECGFGWTNLLRLFFQELDVLDPHGEIKLFCVKEKFGFMDIQNESDLKSFFDDFYKLIARYRALSKSTCEVCGEPGKLRNSGTWMMVRCQKCL